MAFNSITFLVFFLVILFLHNLPFSWRTKKFNLLVASYIFYSAWNPVYVVLIWISTMADWLITKRMARTEGLLPRRILLVVSLAVNLGLLSYFKYGGFFLENFIEFMKLFNVEFHAAKPDIILPVGISFYTFQTLSYTIDVYRGKMKPWGSLLDFSLFVTFFPQLVAGPIVRASHFLPQCVEPRRADVRQMGFGLSLLTIGIFQKEILADLLMAPVVDKIHAASAQVGFVEAWIAAVGFSAQIFYDFAGYSTCAIGAAMCLGFSIPDNFRSPHAAIGFRDFWQRFHMSLSSWLRDYLYTSLGGNRKGRSRAYIYLLITMLLGGLWHGAAWQFVAWGGLHGLFLIAERIVRRFFGDTDLSGKLPVRILLVFLTFLGVSLAQVFFRAQDFTGAFHIVSAMFVGGVNQLVLTNYEITSVLAVTGFLLASHWIMYDRNLKDELGRIPWWLLAITLSGMILAVILQPGDTRAFIYFQF